MEVAYRTEFGTFFNGKIEDFLISNVADQYKGNVDLIFTSPPFPLNRKKKYGNLQGQEYIDWISKLSIKFGDLLSDRGSIVIEIGNSWVAGSPEMSTLPMKALLAFQETGQYHLCQQFIWNNPARLPGPAQWVTVERSRVKDAFTTLWWLSKVPQPKADNKKVLVEYSESMKKLLLNRKYNSGKRPSEHLIGQESFFKDNSGAIPSNVITLSNTSSNSDYQKYCKENSIEVHPARMPEGLVEFFVKFLTEEGDLVLDPFAGSNTTGKIAESLQRNWVSIEVNNQYILGSVGRFQDSILDLNI